MPWRPGWDSIESTDFWNTFYFWFGIACLFLLGISEVISHYYGRRHSALVAVSVGSPEYQREENARRDREVVDAREAAKTAQQELDRFKAPRTLTAEQRSRVIEAVKRSSVSLSLPTQQTAEPQFLEAQIEAALKQAGWT